MTIMVDGNLTKIDGEFDTVFRVLKGLIERGHTIKIKENGVWKVLKEY